MKPYRRDALPEHWLFVDRGCELHPACLSCPLPVCKHDEPHGLASARAVHVRSAAARLRAAGLRAEEIAPLIGRSRRTVFRLLALPAEALPIRSSRPIREAFREHAGKEVPCATRTTRSRSPSRARATAGVRV